MPGHYDGPPKPPAPPAPTPRSGASKDARTIPFGSGNTEDGSVNDETRHNPWGKGSKKNPTNSSLTTGP